ncbi:cysteine desulfurase / selenocysteine lyase [Propionibacterium cyclohexanicum]|uniref:Cysteine desulfurase n=1 Tax=Propionibacterium cyclohexanicum TaxID=64702 RepID=A0A1H9PMV3_9ACTN|nr:cysteine desulfurase [Propionibacterium cyclohexanicum]SER49139.1 cysteine desulfurase / selenocysteine lyase [Propionibacterium cyclohexanicum]
MNSTSDDYDIETIRRDFPILSRQVHGHPLVYLDSSNTSQKPRVVIDAISDHYAQHNANVARAMHELGAEATAAYEGARAKVAHFVAAAEPAEIVFTKNSSEALNLAAHTLGASLRPGDEVVVSVLEHHSNLVPWQLACQRTGATLRWFDITPQGRLDLEAAEREGLINEHTKVVSLAWVSNVLGTVNPLRRIAEQAHAYGAVVVADGSQGVPHLPTDVGTLGVDMLAFTGHKMCGPTGIGVLWGRRALLDELPPFLGGGEMIGEVRMEGSTWAEIPHKFEAGTPPIAQAVGLGVAVDYLETIGMGAIARHDHQITAHMLEALGELDFVHVMGPDKPVDRGSAVSFTVDGVHPHDLMQLLDSRGVAVRGGHHCAEPLHRRLSISSSARASGYLYSTDSEVDALCEALTWAHAFFTGRVAARA